MKSGEIRDTGWKLTLHEILFSLNLGYACTSLVLRSAPRSITDPLRQAGISIDKALHIIQVPDFRTPYWETFIPTIVGAFIVWLLVRVSRDARITREILRSAAGAAALLAVAVCWYDFVGWWWPWPYRMAPIEIAMTCACFLLFLYKRWPFPGWCSALFLAIHFAFWFWLSTGFGSLEAIQWRGAALTYAGPIGPIVGFCASLAWGLHLNQSSETRQKPGERWDPQPQSHSNDILTSTIEN